MVFDVDEEPRQGGELLKWHERENKGHEPDSALLVAALAAVIQA